MSVNRRYGAPRAGIESRHLLQELHGFIVKHKVSERCEELVRIAAFQFRDVYITVHIAQKNPGADISRNGRTVPCAFPLYRRCG